MAFYARRNARAHCGCLHDLRAFPETLDHDFIHAVKEVISGLSKGVVTTYELRTALLSRGSPATLGEMKKRPEECLDDKAKGKDPGKVRIVLE
ncbi:MAG: hypothetical protein KAY24_13275 [Candidatus Eisenbacteria sp.]|nr:hypothetical protein [Candidatus Eisenbacteria bacterium]